MNLSILRIEKFRTILPLLMGSMLWPGWTDAQDRMLGLIEQEISEIAHRVESTVVSVYANIPLADQDEGGRWNVGSGVVLDSTGYVITMDRVIHGAERIEVVFPNGHQYAGRRVGCDLETGIAVLHVQGKNLQGPPLGDSDHIEGGECVFVIGNTMGLIAPSALGLINGRRPEKGLLQLSLRLSPGNTGAPVFNRQGRVLGIMMGELSNTSDAASDTRRLKAREPGVSLAVPINTVRQIAQEIIAQDHGQCGWLGIDILDLPPIGMKGIPVWRVMPKSPAEKAGVHKDDILVEYNSHPVTEASELAAQIRGTPSGTKVRLKLKRGNQYKVVVLEVGEKPPLAERK